MMVQANGMQMVWLVLLDLPECTPFGNKSGNIIEVFGFNGTIRPFEFYEQAAQNLAACIFILRPRLFSRGRDSIKKR